jgi:hypothetical protein
LIDQPLAQLLKVRKGWRVDLQGPAFASLKLQALHLSQCAVAVAPLVGELRQAQGDAVVVVIFGLLL